MFIPISQVKIEYNNHTKKTIFTIYNNKSTFTNYILQGEHIPSIINIIQNTNNINFPTIIEVDTLSNKIKQL